jgi:uncharacterized protein (TIGR02266 family)
MSDAQRRSTASGLSNRKQNRARKRLLVRYGEETPDQKAFTQNLSEGGMYVKTNDVLPPGTELTLEIQTDEGTFLLQGVIAWVKRVPANLAHLLPAGMGIQLTQPPRAWIEFCERWKKI